MSLSRRFAIGLADAQRFTASFVICLGAIGFGCDSTAGRVGADANDTYGTTDSRGPGELDASPSDSKTKTGHYEPPQAWQGIDNECAPNRRVVAPETHDEPALPDDTGETPRVAWKRTQICPNDPIFSRPDLKSEKKESVLTRMEVDGEVRNLLFVPKTNFGKNFVFWKEAVAMLDADTGKPLECFSPPRGRRQTTEISVGQRLIAVPELGRVYSMYLPSYTESLTPENPNPEFSVPIGVVSWAPNGTREIVAEWDVLARGYQGPTWMPNGQILWIYGERRLISVDVKRKQTRWTVGPYDFFESPIRSNEPDKEKLWLKGPVRDGPLTAAVAGFRQKEDGLERIHPRVDHCGNLDQGKKFWDRMSLEKGKALMAGQKAEIYDNEGDLVNTIEGCGEFITVGKNRLGCRNLPNYKTVDIDGSDVRERQVRHKELGIPDDAQSSGVLGSMTAGRGEVLIVAVEYGIRRDGETEHYVRIAFIPMGPETIDDSIRGVDLKAPDHDIREGNSGSFLISPTGMVIFEAWGYVYGIQTRIPGLAKGPYPRGPIGGNENRGPVGGYPSLSPPER